MSPITLSYIKENLSIHVVAKLLEHDIAKYSFYHPCLLSAVSEELLKATLISWATIDLCFSNRLIINISCTFGTQKYIVEHYQYVTNTYSYQFKKKCAQIDFVQIAKIIDCKPLELDCNGYFSWKNFFCHST